MIRHFRNLGALWAVATIIIGTVQVIPPDTLAATGPSALLSKADSQFRSLESRQSLQKYRHNYVKVEKLYRKVFEGYKGTAEAAEALYRCGQLHTLLYRWTSLRSDLDSARDYYGTVLREYPKSRVADDAQVETAFLYLNYFNDPVQSYREFARAAEQYPGGDRAAEAGRWLRKLRRYKAEATASPRRTLPVKASPSSADREASALLSRAENEFGSLRKSSSLQKYRHHYTRVLDLYRRVFDGRPGSGEAQTALFRAGELYALLYRWTSSKSDLNSAKHYYERLARDYPESPLADDARMAVAYLYLEKYKDPSRAYEEFRKAANSPDGDRRSEAERHLRELQRYRPVVAEPAQPPTSTSPLPAVLARVEGIRHWSNPAYTRVVIDLDRSSNFYSNLLRESTALHKPPRLYVDLFNALVATRLRTTIPVNDGILHSIRAGQFTPDTVRVVLDIDQLESYSVFPMENPFRVVIDARGGGQGARPPAVASPGRSLPETGAGRSGAPPPPAASSPSLARQLGLRVGKVVIDAGHGARDPGAIGVGGIKEKSVTLDLALRLRDLLRREGLEVVMTREKDVYLPLEERTAIANRTAGDLFISLHANSSRDSNLSGIETYSLNLASSKRAKEAAAIENSMSMAKMSDLEEIVQEIFNSKMDESTQLRDIVHRNLVAQMRRHYRDIKDLGVKQAPFYVLIGAQIPSILAEVSFINHRVEGARLGTDGYRQQLAESLASGIMDYISTVRMASAGP